MANALYDYGREGFLDDGAIKWGKDDIRVMLVLSTYRFSAAHKFVSDLGAVDNGRSGPLVGKSATNGIADAADASLRALDASATKALVLFKHTGDDESARLIAYIDSPTAGLPFTPAAGQMLNIEWNNGAHKIFKL